MSVCKTGQKMVDYKPIGSRLRSMREALGKQQKEVAAELDMSPGNYGSYELGIKGISLYRIITLATYYGCSLDYLVFGNRPPPVSERKKETIRKAKKRANKKPTEPAPVDDGPVEDTDGEPFERRITHWKR